MTDEIISGKRRGFLGAAALVLTGTMTGVIRNPADWIGKPGFPALGRGW